MKIAMNTREGKAPVKNVSGSVGKKVVIGAGIAAATAAVAAGAYFFFGSKNAKKNRKQLKAWSITAKGEVLERIEKLTEVNEEIYKKVVDEVAAEYKKIKKLDAEDVTDFIAELKSHWTDIAKKIGISKK